MSIIYQYRSQPIVFADNDTLTQEWSSATDALYSLYFHLDHLILGLLSLKATFGGTKTKEQLGAMDYIKK